MKTLLALGILFLLPTFALADENVRGYYRKDGTYVEPYRRSSPDSSPYNNFNFPGNTNPYTGRTAPGDPDAYLERYNNRPNNSPYQNPYRPFGK